MKALKLATTCLCFAAGLQAVEVPLYIRPDSGLDPVSSLEASSGVLAKARSVSDPRLSAQGWQWVESPATITGYVSIAYLSNESIQAGAPVRLSPNNDGHVFTFISSFDKTSIIKSGEWVTIEIEKSLPLYFNSTAASDFLEQPLPLAEETPAQKQEEVVVLPAITGTIERPAQRATRPEQRPVYQRPTHVYPQRPESPNAITQQYFEGTLHRAKGGLFSAPPYPLELHSLAGGRIAYIDTSNMLAHGSISQYLDKPVIVEGRSEANRGNTPMVIHARSLRMR